jgi:multidrug transporter EmrE-like cation transporter
VEEIIEQGEGARGDWRDAHYGRFLNMWEEYSALRERDPSFEPARAVVPAFSRQPFDVTADRIVITEPLTARVAEVTALSYEVVLHVLLRFFTHTDETEEQLGTLVGAAIDMMASVLRPLAVALTTLPVGPAYPGHTAGFGFEMFYVMTNAVPWRTPAWTVIHERMSLLAAKCAELGAEDAAPQAVRDAGVQAAAVAATLRAHLG